MRHLFIIIMCLVATTVGAQQLTHDFRNTSLSEALIWIDNAQSSYKINFIFDELEDFTVTTSLRKASVKDAVRQVVGFYPMRVTSEDKDIYVECMQKAETKLTGHVIDEHGKPLSYVTVSLLAPKDSAFITGGVSNENGDFVVPCQPRQLIVKLTYVGYKTVTRNASVERLGTIAMKPEAYMMQGVTVKGEVSMLAASSGMRSQLSGIDNIRFKCLLMGYSNEQIKKIEQDIVDFADIGIHIDQPVKTYSSGMRSRLGFAIAVHIDPDILIIDEALSVGDQSFTDKCLDKVNAFKEAGKTIVFVSHAITTMTTFCDRVIWINRGSLVGEGAPADIVKAYGGFAREFNGMTNEQRATFTPVLEDYQRRYCD